MQTIRYIMSGVAGLLLLNSCVKDELYKTPHPDKGRITITADWSHRSTDCPLPEEYVLLHSCCEVTALKALRSASSATLLCLSPTPIHSSHGTKPTE